MNDEFILDHITSLSTKVDRLLALAECLDERSHTLDERLRKHESLLEGPEGLCVRVDRIEQRAKQMTWALGVAVTALSTALFDLFQRWLWGGIH